MRIDDAQASREHARVARRGGVCDRRSRQPQRHLAERGDVRGERAHAALGRSWFASAPSRSWWPRRRPASRRRRPAPARGEVARAARRDVGRHARRWCASRPSAEALGAHGDRARRRPPSSRRRRDGDTPASFATTPASRDRRAAPSWRRAGALARGTVRPDDGDDAERAVARASSPAPRSPRARRPAVPRRPGVVVADAAMVRVFEMVARRAHADDGARSSARPASARRSSPSRSTAEPARARARSCGSTAPRCPRRCSRASCSATSAARSPAPTAAQARLPRGRRRRHALPRRDRRAARCRLQAKLLRVLETRDVHARRRRERDRRRRARRRRHQPRSRRRGRARQLPRGPLLPARRPSPSRCRRCASGRPRSRCSPSSSCASSPQRAGRRRAGDRARRVGGARRHRWPGNVRELRNAIERALVLVDGRATSQPDAPAARPRAPRRRRRPRVARGADRAISSPTSSCAPSKRRWQAENGNQTRAAKRLGISRRALIYKMEKYGLGKKLAAAQVADDGV